MKAIPKRKKGGKIFQAVLRKVKQQETFHGDGPGYNDHSGSDSHSKDSP